ncbi:hypothetical protein ABHN05_17595 [Brevibacillus laterosporus]
MINYLKNTDQPNSEKCIRFISDAGYGGGGDQYYDEVIDYLDTLRRRSDI